MRQKLPGDGLLARVQVRAIAAISSPAQGAGCEQQRLNAAIAPAQHIDRPVFRWSAAPQVVGHFLVGDFVGCRGPALVPLSMAITL